MGPEARRSAVEKLLARAEDQHAKSRRTGSGQGPAPKHLDRNVRNYLRQKVYILAQLALLNVCELFGSDFMLPFLHILNWEH